MVGGSDAAGSPFGEPASATLGRVTTGEAIVKALKERIYSGELLPGTPLREIELGKYFGVSRQSLRDALIELVHLGLLDRESYRGIRVREITREDIEDLIYVRSLIESEAVLTVVAIGGPWTEIESALEAMNHVSADTPFSSMIETDLNFHRSIVRAARSPRLTRLHDQVCAETRLHMASVLREVEEYRGIRSLHGEHEAILRAMMSGDGSAAVDALHGVLDNGRKVLTADVDPEPSK
jgi:DNA-binding GntR family transcriptional regulator